MATWASIMWSSTSVAKGGAVGADRPSARILDENSRRPLHARTAPWRTSRERVLFITVTPHIQNCAWSHVLQLPRAIRE